MRRPCSCGRPIYRGRHGRLTGPGLAKFWVAGADWTWRHLDGTEACDPPAPGRIRAQAGHLGAVEQYVWVVFLVVFVVLAARLLGMTF